MSAPPPTRQVFFDPSKRRWRRVSRVIALVAIVVTVLLGTIAIGIFVHPGLPRLELPSGHASGLKRISSKPATTAQESAFRAAKHDLRQYLMHSLPPLSPIATNKFERIAFYVNWDDNSWVSLKRNLDDIDTITAEWLHLADGSGAVALDEPTKQKTVLEYLRRHRPNIRVNALINNFKDSAWDRGSLRTMLANAESRRRCIEAIERYLVEQKLSGINIDFESVPDESQKHLVQFMRELREKLQTHNLELSQSVPIDDDRFDFRKLAASVDYLMLMSYDENASDNEAGPVASQAWFTREIQRRLRAVPANKLVIGIGSYGYDWTKSQPPAEEISFQDAVRIASESAGDIELDDASGNPHFDYADDANQTHTVWFLDAITAFNQVQAASRLNPRGFALWRLGSEDPGVWSVLRKAGALDADTAKSLQAIHFEYDLDYRGKGEILRVTGTPQTGKRRVKYDADIGLLTDDAIEKDPSGYTIQRWGFNPEHAIALTFDDGPDPEWTPQILRILQAKHALATFFVIGSNAESNPDLLRDVFDAGHELGNHTYTHPNIANVSDKRVELELNATQRLFESRLGIRSLLFRPPYAEDVEPETPDQVHPLVLTSSLGYYSVGMQIDPDDWARPGSDAIVQRVLESARAGEGNVVLLHDSGGDRSQTVTALPKIIDALRADGFKLVTISELLHVPRAAVMPTVVSQGNVQFWMEDMGFQLVNGVDRTLRVLFLLGIALGLLRFAVILGLATFRALRRHGIATNNSVKASVIVPAYNEERVIARTVRSLLSSQDIELEIIVVDDGSTDQTAAEVMRSFAHEPRVRLLRQENAGKAEALNHGIGVANHDVIIVLDADTVFLPDTAARLARHFGDERIGAVAGNAKVGNRNNLLTRWQALEYITSQNLERRAFEVLNCITVVPGAVGAWRRSAIVQAGGFSHETLAEDADLTMRIVRLGLRVIFDGKAIAYTEAPQGVRAFVKQRFRWMFGTLQASWKHRNVLLRSRGGTLGAIALPNVLVFQIFFPLVSPVMDLLMLWTMLRALFGHQSHPNEIELMNSAFVQTLYYYGLFLVIDLATAILAYLFEPDEDWRLLLWLPLQRFFYRQLIYYVAIKSLVTALRGPQVGWGKSQRYGSVDSSRLRG